MATDLSDPPEVEAPGDDGQPIHWVTVATFTEPTAAHVARLRLESDGIPCLVADENIGTALWHYAFATGGIKLQVPAEQVAAAADALTPASQYEPLTSESDDDDACPRCRYRNIYGGNQLRRRFAIFFLALLAATFHPLLGIIALIAGICFFVTTRKYRCPACGAEWTPSPNRGFDVITKSEEP